MAGPGPPTIELEVLAEPHALCRLEPSAPVPGWAGDEPGDGIVSVSRTGTELSIVCPERLLPDSQPREGDRRALRVSGTLEHSLTGILAAIAAPLARARVPIFAISTWDTDYVLLAHADLERALAALRDAGHRIAPAPAGP